jgi:hypothetical protein
MCSSIATSAGAPFAQRLTGRCSADDATIGGRRELAEDGETWRTGVDVISPP